MIPLLALGIPGSATTAVMLGGLTIHGIVPGPLLMEQNTRLVYSVFIAMMFANVLMLAFGLRAARYFALILTVPYAYVGPAIIVMCMTGIYGLNGNMVDLGVMLAFGAVGVLLRFMRYPVASFIIGLVLGPIAEKSLRQGLMMTDYSYLEFASRPITGTLLALSALSLLYGLWGQYKRSRDTGRGGGSVETAS
jgi:putative tricarboxylic transport membrane protein